MTLHTTIHRNLFYWHYRRFYRRFVLRLICCVVWSHQSHLYWPRRFEFRSLAVGRCDERGENRTINDCPFRSHRIESKHDDDWALATWNLIAMVSLASHFPLAQNELVGCRAKASTHAAYIWNDFLFRNWCFKLSHTRWNNSNNNRTHFQTRTLFNAYLSNSCLVQRSMNTKMGHVCIIAVCQSYAFPRISTFGLNDELNIVESSRIWNCGTSA